jgi:ubiquinone/menaquinone biosynthesis C-methylase UbiE
MTDEMLLLHAKTREAGMRKRRVSKGEIENIPLPDNSVDVIIRIA